MRDVAVVGAGMTRFGKFLEQSMKELGQEAVQDALDDSGLQKQDIEAAMVGNAVGGLMTGQEMVRGQTILRPFGFGDIPIINTENACASSSTAFHLAWMYVASGMHDCVLALGVEKLYHEDKAKSFAAIGTAVDLEIEGEGSDGAGETRTRFMDFYADKAKEHMAKYGTKAQHFAKVAVKNHGNGAINPYAQFRKPFTLEDVLGARMVAEPLTLYMCSGIGDGAAATILCSPEKARQLTTDPIWVRGSEISSGMDLHEGDAPVAERVSKRAYERAGIGPSDLDVVELHDAAAPAEISLTEELGLCAYGEGGALIDSGETNIGGRIPVNPSGGLMARGHPIGATGLGQLVEVCWQLQGKAGERQVRDAKVGLTHNAGGEIRGEAAVNTVHLLSR